MYDLRVPDTGQSFSKLHMSGQTLPRRGPLSKPEATSSSCATNLSKYNMTAFFNNLQQSSISLREKKMVSNRNSDIMLDIAQQKNDHR